MNTPDNDERDEQETAKRRDDALKRALGMPHKPHKPAKPKRRKPKESHD
jgi:hypothetical protein